LKFRQSIAVLTGCIVLPIVMAMQCHGEDSADQGPEVHLKPVVDFESEIRPIFAARCFKCHGPVNPEAGLNLADIRSAFEVHDSGEMPIVPGDPSQSALLTRVTTTDVDARMPPQGERLTADEIKSLRNWIASGAPWPKHWAYAPLQNNGVPKLNDESLQAWSLNSIDRFIAARLAEKGMSPSPPADKRTFLRRVTFDLIGMPPTPEEIDAFIADDSLDAYERVVDRLLASPRYGERWARHWMDIVHFAETHGHDQDRPRENAWPYRDYLIESLNQDKPYARFVQEQVAGDILFPDDPAAIVATGFLAAGPWDESSLRDIREDSVDREIARYIDRDDIVTTVMSTFVSSSVHCARCHHHKFDPISQEEYYGLQAIFAGIDKANRLYDPDPIVAERRKQLEQQIAESKEMLNNLDPRLLNADLQHQVAKWESSSADLLNAWRTLDPEVVTFQSAATFSKLDDYSLLVSGERPETDVYTIEANTRLKSLTAVRLELLNDESLPANGPGRCDNGNLHLNHFRLFAVESVPESEGKPEANHRELTLIDPVADFDQAGWEIVKSIDGNPATAWGIFPEVSKPHQAVFNLRETLQSDGDIRLRFELHQIHGGSHLIGRFRLSVTEHPLPLPEMAGALAAEISSILQTTPDQRTDAQRMRLAAFILVENLEQRLAALPAKQMLYCGTNRFQADGSFRPSEKPRDVQVLSRGMISQPLAAARPQFLTCIEGLNGEAHLTDADDEGQRRAELARWLTEDANVLTWRSVANRIWQYHFGSPLVATPNDFGQMGIAPTHPLLLDWLAAELLKNDGSLKHLHRLIVTSATYRQSSADREEFSRVDADNHLLWRMNRQRLDAESFRDALLVVSQSLDDRMGGPSVKQFNLSAGIHVTPNIDYMNFDVNDPSNFRRSVYRFLFRTIPDPFMEALDCPDASQLTPERNVSVTALQALATMNDKFVIRQCELLAARIERLESDERLRVQLAYRQILGRLPDESEAQLVTAYAQQHGWANACRFLLNTNEFLFVD
jgi:hypothetical protein